MREIKVEIGKSQKFDNGCTVWYDTIDYKGYWVVSNPYGIIDEVIEENNVIDLEKYLNFWDEERDEYGNLHVSCDITNDGKGYWDDFIF